MFDDMRIGIFDNLANNAYSLVRIFRRKGYEADLLLDSSDTFPMSQPVWEDCDFTISTDLLKKKRLTKQYWGEKSLELGWEKPEWIKEVRRKGRRRILLGVLLHPFKHLHSLAKLGRYGSLFTFSSEPIKEAMRGYDVIIAFGLGPIYAFSANVPFIHYPYGGDLTLIPFQKNCIGSLQREALEKVKYIIVGDPGYLEYLKRLGIESKAEFIPFMIDTDRYKPISKNQALLVLESDLHHKVRNRFVFFVPSRQDFYWKGSDKILMAFAKLVQKREDVFIILSGWGDDLEKSKEMVDQLKLKDHTFFLPYILSKKKLIAYYGLTDAVIDQFTLGAYGTSSMEAMACGKPVIIDFDIGRYAPYFKELPPVLMAKSVEEIYLQMLILSENKNNICEQIGQKLREWVTEFHGIKNNFERLVKLCQQCLS